MPLGLVATVFTAATEDNIHLEAEDIHLEAAEGPTEQYDEIPKEFEDTLEELGPETSTIQLLSIRTKFLMSKL